MKHFALRLLVATLTFCFGLTCTSQYRAFVIQRRHNQLIARERQLFQMRATEIESLLNNLVMGEEITEGDHKVIQCSNHKTPRITERLMQIANESSEARSQVIGALIRVVDSPSIPDECPFEDERWTAAVYMLGDLRATEAIDVLVRNLDQTRSMFVSLGYHPVMSAVVRIGEPAIPRLIEALSDEKPRIRAEATGTLADIGQSAVGRLQEVLHNGTAETKGRAALALVWIGPEGNVPIFRAIERETDQEALSKLNDALKEWHRHWGR